MNPIRVLVTADDPLTRAGLATLLGAQAGCLVVGQIASAGLADAIPIYRPDVVVCDFNIDQTQNFSDTRVPVLTLVADPTHVSAAWNAGVRGILLRSASAENLAAAIAAIAQDLVVLDPEFAGDLVHARGSAESSAEELTPRETQVLHLLAQGQSNKAIARALDISEHTVKFHVNAILGKLNAQSRTEAVVNATRRGWILL